MFPSVHISDTLIHNSNPDSNPNPNPSYFHQEHDDAPPPLLYSNFPSPFFDDQSDFFYSQQQQHIFNNDEISVSPKHDLGSDHQAQASMSLAADLPPRKMRKDRHSKICTAQGVRARRMRLPLQIARKFFDLQDMLGYDKASKTIEWLLSKSRGAIREITKNIPSSSRSEKGYDSWDSMEGHEKKKRELREKARSRARERTLEKIRMRNTGKMTKLGCSASALSKLDSSFDSSSSHQSLDKQISNVGIKSDCSISRFHHYDNILGGFDFNNMNNINSFTEFLENCNVQDSREV